MMPAGLLLAGLLESTMWHAPLRATDLASTEYGIAYTSATERHPLGNSSGSRAALAIGAAAGATWLDHKLEKHWGKWVLRAGHVVLTAVVVKHNMAEIRKQRGGGAGADRRR